MIKRLRVSVGVGLGLESRVEQLVKQFRRQQCAPLGQCSIGNGFASELFHMLRQCASLRHHMEDQPLNQLGLSHHGRPATTHPTTNKKRVDQRPWYEFVEQCLESSCRDRRFVSHPKLNETDCLIVQGKYCLVTTYANSYTALGLGSIQARIPERRKETDDAPP